MCEEMKRDVCRREESTRPYFNEDEKNEFFFGTPLNVGEAKSFLNVSIFGEPSLVMS